MIEPNVVPSTIADVFSGVSHNIIATVNPTGFDFCGQGQEALDCDKRVKSLSLYDCPIQDPFAFSGDLNFYYSNSECQISSPGDYIEKTFDAELDGYNAFYITINSDRRKTYNNVDVPDDGLDGKQILTYTGDSHAKKTWSYSAEGFHRYGSLEAGVVSVKPLNHSVLTTEDFHFVGDDLTTLSSLQNEEGIHEGKILFYNNQAKYYGELSQKQEAPLVFESCSCPTSGILEGEFDGDSIAWDSYDEEEKTMRIEFAGCGLAHFTFKGETHESVQLDSCFGL